MAESRMPLAVTEKDGTRAYIFTGDQGRSPARICSGNMFGSPAAAKTSCAICPATW